MSDGHPGEPLPAAATATVPAPRRRLVLTTLPLLLFILLAALFYLRLGAGDPGKLPSALIGRPVPDMALPPLEGLAPDGAPLPGLAPADLKGGVTLVNVFASWCGPCREEHPVLMRLAQDGRIRLVAINYKDSTENARRFLGSLGNPYAAVGVDAKGRAAIDWGVYGVPETFLIGKDGTIRYKFVGPLTDDVVASTLDSEIAKALR